MQWVWSVGVVSLQGCRTGSGQILYHVGVQGEENYGMRGQVRGGEGAGESGEGGEEKGGRGRVLYRGGTMGYPP